MIPIDGQDSYWVDSFLQTQTNLPLCYSMIAFFFSIGIAHLVFALRYRTFYLIWVVVGCGVMTTGFAMQVVAIHYSYVMLLYAIQESLIIVGPAFIMTGFYFIVTKIVRFLDSEDLYLCGNVFAILFMAINFVSSAMAFAGSFILLANYHNQSNNTTLENVENNIRLAGLELQLVLFTAFLVFAVWVHCRCRRKVGQWHSLMTFVHLGAVLIMIRTLYHILEEFNLVQEFGEQGRYLMDTGPVLLSVVGFIFFHPGRILIDNSSDFFSEWTKQLQGQNPKPRNLRLYAAHGSRI